MQIKRYHFAHILANGSWRHSTYVSLTGFRDALNYAKKLSKQNNDTIVRFQSDVDKWGEIFYHYEGDSGRLLKAEKADSICAFMLDGTCIISDVSLPLDTIAETIPVTPSPVQDTAIHNIAKPYADAIEEKAEQQQGIHYTLPLVNTGIEFTLCVPNENGLELIAVTMNDILYNSEISDVNYMHALRLIPGTLFGMNIGETRVKVIYVAGNNRSMLIMRTK